MQILLALGNSLATLKICMNEWFTADKQLMNDFEWYCKNNKYFLNNSGSSSGERLKTIDTFKNRNKDLREKIVQKLTEKFYETNFISGPNVIEPDAINGSKPAERYKNAIAKHFGMVYKHHKLSNGYALTANDLRSAVRKTQLSNFDDLTPAEQMVEDHIAAMGGVLTVTDIVQKFEAIPFGWKDVAIIHMIAELNRKKKRELEFRNQPRYKVTDFVEKALNTNDRMACVVREGEEISQTLIDDTLLVYRNIFNTDLPHTTDGNKLFDTIGVNLNKVFDTYSPYQEEYFGSYPFGIHFNALCQKIDTWIKIRDPKRLFTTLASEQNEGKVLFDQAKALVEFTNRMIDAYNSIRQFYADNKENFASLEPDEQQKADDMAEFFRSDDPARDFRHIRKAYDELKAAISQLRESLQQKAIETYEQLFAELDTEAQKMGLTNRNCYGNKEYTLNNIRKQKSITAIRYEIERAPSFKSQQVAIIVNEASKLKPDDTNPKAQVVNEAHEFYITKLATVIRSEKELDEYLAKARAEMLKLLNDKKTIIIK